MEAFVHIIESPSDIDLLEGRKQGGALGEALGLARIPYFYNLVTTHNSFKTSLYDNLIKAMEYYPNKLPILHFTMHGNHQGIELTDKTDLKWHELQESILPIQKALGSLLICMSSCQGSSAFEMAINKDNLPFLFLLGNNDLVSWSDATVAYITFYHLLFKFGMENLIHCFEAMKTASGNNNFELWNGDDIQQSYQRYIKEKRLEVLKQYLRNNRRF